MTGLAVRAMSRQDWPAVERIYAEGIATGNATFEADMPSWERFDGGHHPFARLVAVEGERIVGWAALSPVSARPAYGGVAEVSIYVSSDRLRRGIGRALLDAAVAESEANGLWTLQATILAGNDASVALHAKAGFRLVGRRERIGRVAGRWRDTILMERRSAAVG